MTHSLHLTQDSTETEDASEDSACGLGTDDQVYATLMDTVEKTTPVPNRAMRLANKIAK